ncbi:MAG TPA: hypothetical protein VMU57_05680 [Edaphobacter sp.]|uniref:lysozyme inhibitor LprI family protein n=1 Tax=Edaphobacter sp. TaxID=1934404 RepID=UPI002BA0D595|nr:hypothetical protein [Edaphobacter sp.]HUZ94386.1 hypothetical protein [Edaphobacter sp.]
MTSRSTSFLLIAAVFFFVPQAFPVPIHCAKAVTPNEKTICSDPTLIQADARMDTLYNISLHFVAMGTRGDLQDQQPVWISEREACGTSKPCIRAAYKKRTAVFEAIMKRVATFGPF